MAALSDVEPGLSPEELARAPRWSGLRTRALTTRVRGILLRDWAAHVRTGFGEGALAAVRARADVSPAALPDAPDLRAWYPARLQLRVTEAIIDECLGGDALALGELLRAVGPTTRDRALRWALTKVGPGPMLRGAARAHGRLYDQGAAVAKTRRGAAEVEVTGGPLFAHPTWRLLQLLAIRTMLRALGRAEKALTVEDVPASPAGGGEDTGGPPAPRGALFRVRWE